MNDQQLQSLRNLGNEAEAAVNEICRLRDELELCCKLKRHYQEQVSLAAPAPCKRFGCPWPYMCGANQRCSQESDRQREAAAKGASSNNALE